LAFLVVKIGWENMCKVVEMELSLMYDILYTKAAKIQTCSMSYFIRIASPVTTAIMTILFWCSSKDAQRRPDVIITYILLVVTFLLEVRWLLRVTASTWTYAFFNEAQAQGESWLQHQVFCTGRWHRLRRLIFSLDPQQLLWWKPRGSYRLWTGTIGWEVQPVWGVLQSWFSERYVQQNVGSGDSIRGHQD